MIKRSLAILCVIIFTVIFPSKLLAATTIGQDVSQQLPINSNMETESEATAIKSQLKALDSTAELTQDRVSGNYAVKVSVKDEPTYAYASYTLATSVTFTVSEYSKINLWVKPDVGAKWIQFYFSDSKLIKTDKDANGTYEVGQDLISGKWNRIELDLTKLDSTVISGKNLRVRTNEYSSWSYDEIKSSPALSNNIDLSRMTNPTTHLVDGELQFKPNGDKYVITPTTLVTNRYPSFQRIDTVKSDFEQGTLDSASITDQDSVQFQLPDSCTEGTAISGGDYSSYPASQAFDNTTTSWQSQQTGSGVNGNAYIGYNFGTAKTVKWLRIKQTISSQSIYNAKLQYYDEQNPLNPIWRDVQILNLNTGSDWQFFSVSTSVSASKWRLLANSSLIGDSISRWAIQEIEFSTNSGSYISPVINISDATYCGISVLDWNTSENTELEVQTRLSLNGGSGWNNWETLVKGGPIPDITETTNLSNARLQYKASVKSTSSSLPQLNDIHIKVIGQDYPNIPNIGNGKLSSVNINSDYIYQGNHIEKLAEKVKTVLFYTTNPILTLSGDGSKLFYINKYDHDLYMYELGTGATSKISDYTNISISKIKVNYDGSKVAFLGAANDREPELYFYNKESTPAITNLGQMGDFDLRSDGTLFYYDNVADCIKKGSQTISSPSISTLDFLVAPKSGNTVFYSVGNSLYICTLTPYNSTFWRSELLTTTSLSIRGIWTNSSATIIFIKLTDNGLYSYHIDSKAMRKLDIDPISMPDIVRVLDDDKLVIQDKNFYYKIYNTNTGEYSDIRPEDAKNVSNYLGKTEIDFDVDASGKKMAYPSSDNTIKIYYMDGAPRPERYLLSFDGKKSWYSHKDGGWALVSTEYMPVKNDFDQYGMTIDEVNSLNKGDFATLYEGGKEIYNVDAAIYFTSLDPYTTPSLKSIKITVDRDISDTDNLASGKALYAAKEESFDGSSWRKIKKVYPIEISPKDSEYYYFVRTGGKYEYYDQNQWKVGAVGEIEALLADVEKNWIKITSLGMSSEEIKNIPEAALTSELARKDFSIIYCMKVYDASTDGYKSMLKVDHVDDLFSSTNLTLKIVLNDGTLKQFTGLTDTVVEDIMEWINERQYNRGPIFYEIKTGTNHEFINYYMIQNISVGEL